MSAIFIDSALAATIDNSPDDTYSEAYVKLVAQAIIHQLEYLAAGLAERRAGLIWFIPLCNDGWDY
jgi:hypothetical protein